MSVCARKATPAEADGGDMLGCAGGHWVMGTPYTTNTSLSLPHTIAFGLYEPKIYDVIAPRKEPMNESLVSTPAECVALVRRDFPEARAAEYSNSGKEWCNAVFGEMGGVIYDPMVQSCIFDEGAL